MLAETKTREPWMDEVPGEEELKKALNPFYIEPFEHLPKFVGFEDDAEAEVDADEVLIHFVPKLNDLWPFMVKEIRTIHNKPIRLRDYQVKAESNFAEWKELLLSIVDTFGQDFLGIFHAKKAVALMFASHKRANRCEPSLEFLDKLKLESTVTILFSLPKSESYLELGQRVANYIGQSCCDIELMLPIVLPDTPIGKAIGLSIRPNPTHHGFFSLS